MNLSPCRASDTVKLSLSWAEWSEYAGPEILSLCLDENRSLQSRDRDSHRFW